MVDGQLLQISMLKVSEPLEEELRSIRLVLIGLAVAIKANRELKSKLVVYIFALMNVVILQEIEGLNNECVASKSLQYGSV